MDGMHSHETDAFRLLHGARALAGAIKRYEALPSARIATQRTSPGANRPPKQSAHP